MVAAGILNVSFSPYAAPARHMDFLRKDGKAKISL
jgi:hypothetical protein